MAKEWILNSAMNRFQLNFKRNVGPTSESIRRCAPKTLDEWRDYYFKNVRSSEHIESLGKSFISKSLRSFNPRLRKLPNRTALINMMQLVIARSFDGYMTEIKTIYGQLEKEIGVKIVPAAR